MTTTSPKIPEWINIDRLVSPADRERIAKLLPNVTFEFYFRERPDEPPYSEPNAQAEDEG